MSITRVTGNVIKDNTLIPDDFSVGKPLWNTTGYLTAAKFYGDGSLLTGVTATDLNLTTSIINVLTSTTFSGYLTADAFIGDGSQLTNIQKALSVIEVTNLTFAVEPKHNNTIILLNSLSTINIDISPSVFTPGHLTYFIQSNTGRGKFLGSTIYNSNEFYETRKQYSVCQLLNYNLNQWTLYGDLTSTTLTSAPIPVTIITTPIFSSAATFDAGFGFGALSGTDLFMLGQNSYGQLGLNRTVNLTNVLYKVLSARDGNNIVNNPKFNTISLGSYHSMALSGNDIYATGFGSYGQLGLNIGGDQGYYPDRSLFTKVTAPANAKWTNVYAGGFASAALSGEDLYVTGIRGLGLGLPIGGAYDFNRSTFTRITVPNNPKFTTASVRGGNNEGIFALSGIPGDLYVTSIGNLEATGLGRVSGASPTTFTRIVSAFNGPTLILNPKFTQVITGDDYCFALSGTDLYAVGFSDTFSGFSPGNVFGNGVTTRTSFFTKLSGDWTQIATMNGFSFSSTLALSGTALFTTGDNAYGQLGTGDTVGRSTFTRIPGNWNKVYAGYGFNVALSTNNTLFVAGVIGGPPNLTFTQITGVSVPI